MTRLAAALVAAGLFAAAAPALPDGDGQPRGIALAHARLGELRIAAREDLAASPPTVALWILDAQGGPATPLPPLPGTGEWAYFRTASLAAADVDGDGRQDLVAVVEYMTGIGPGGAEPFPWAAVYLQTEEGFARDATREAEANEGALAGTWTGAAELAAALGPAR